jgi:DNA helicase II / ATP-dependent DNA helicase PcrA
MIGIFNARLFTSMNIIEDLNEQQRRVVHGGEGPCLVLAGAGSGKTRTITHRVAYLLENGVSPDNILLVTFTNKAAREMVSRVQSLTADGIRLPWSGTFHHVAFRLLKQYAPLLGYANTFTILDSTDSKDLIKLCVKAEGINRKERRFPSTAATHSLLSYTRNAGRTLEDVLEERYPHWLTHHDILTSISKTYAQKKKDAQAMDFDDLLINTRRLLSSADQVRTKFATQFKYVLVDEYQDTNQIQSSIIDLLASVHQNLLVVGDDAQSIYSFRAADIQNILAFEKRYPNASIFRLETNYRSTPDILALANAVIANNKDQYQKTLTSQADACVKPEAHGFLDAQEEAQHVADRILELCDEGVEFHDMAVLFRAAFHSQALEVELVKRDIPYEYRGGVRFFERAHVKDVLAYLRVFQNASDEVAWSRTLGMQIGIGPGTIEKIATYRLQNAEPQIDSLRDIGQQLSARAKIGWNDFLSVYDAMQASDRSPAGLIRAVADSKYKEHLEAEHLDAKERRQDIEQLARFAERSDDLHSFLADMTLQENFTIRQAQSQHAASARDDEKLVLSTVHQAKGLEWQAVFVIHVGAGLFPHDRALSEAHGIEEERRLFYVAITRAKKFLYVSYPITSHRSMTLGGPSMFLEEIQKDVIDEYPIEGGTSFSSLSDPAADVVYVSQENTWAEKRTSFLKDIDEL